MRCDTSAIWMHRHAGRGGGWGDIARAVLNTLLPPRCQACGAVLVNPAPEQQNTATAPASRRLGSVAPLKGCLCRDCLQGIGLVQSPKCSCCGLMFAGREGPDHLCGPCSRDSWKFSRARAAAVFAGSLADLVHYFKYNGRTGLAFPLGRMMLGKLRDYWDPAGFDALAPVPLHPRRLRERGFNQSALLLRSWTQVDKKFPTGVNKRLLAPGLLERIKPTESQTGLNRQKRVANLKNAFRVSKGSTVAGLRVLLVDDVFTTGATVNECARTLLQAGARRVDVFTLARTQIEYGARNHGKTI